MTKEENLPLRQARRLMKKTSIEVCRELKDKYGVSVDTGNLSRYERGKQSPSSETAAVLAAYYSKTGLTELHILYPERYADQPLDTADKRRKARRKVNRRTGLDRRDPAGRGRRADDSSATPLES
jgi:transcriptional regulator with XRE-family HTH domain